jgi:hypothetical protein
LPIFALFDPGQNTDMIERLQECQSTTSTLIPLLPVGFLPPLTSTRRCEPSLPPQAVSARTSSYSCTDKYRHRFWACGRSPFAHCQQRWCPSIISQPPGSHIRQRALSQIQWGVSRVRHLGGIIRERYELDLAPEGAVGKHQLLEERRQRRVPE